MSLLLARIAAAHRNAAPPAPVTVLDQLATAPMFAYGLRKLRNAYAGKAANVRRSSDNTSIDIGFDASGNLDTAAMMVFVGSGNGYIVKWYDQSGGGNDLTQSTASMQPQIVAAGAVITKGSTGRPTIQYAGAQRLGIAPFAALTMGTAARYSNVVASSGGSSQSFYGWKGPNSSQSSWELYAAASGIGLDVFTGGPSSTLGNSSNLQVMGVAKTSTAQGYAFTNGTQQSLTFPTINTAGGTLYFGYYEASGAWWLNGCISEAVMFNGYVDNDRSILEANQRAYFGI